MSTHEDKAFHGSDCIVCIQRLGYIFSSGFVMAAASSSSASDGGSSDVHRVRLSFSSCRGTQLCCATHGGQDQGKVARETHSVITVQSYSRTTNSFAVRVRDVHRGTCMMRVESLYDSSDKVSSSAIASSNACQYQTSNNTSVDARWVNQSCGLSTTTPYNI